MPTHRLNFKSARTGRPSRAAFYIRWSRLLRRKRVAYARRSAAHALKRAQAEVDRVYHLAAVYDVPMDAMAAMPILPLLPDNVWVECKRAMGELKPVVKRTTTADSPAAAEAMRPARAAS